MRADMFFTQKKKDSNVWNPKIKMSNNYLDHLKYKLGLQLICLIMCSTGFLYQSSQLITLYSSGKTIVENRVERFKYSQLPAITICMPTFMDMEKFANNWLKSSTDPEHKNLYEEFLELKEMVSKEVLWSKDTQDKQIVLFEKFLWNVFIKGSNITIGEAFHSFIIDVNMTYRSKEYTNPSLAFNESGELITLPVPKIVKSFIPLLDPRICITLFSDFDDYYRDLRLSPIQMELHFTHKLMSFPFLRYYEGDFYIALHSSNILPDFKRENIFQKLKMSMVNFITYSESQIKLLPEPFETNCIHYKVNSSGEQNTRNDCIQKCVDERLSHKYGLNCIWTYANLKLIRRENLFNETDRKFCDHQIEPRIWGITEEQYRLTNLCEDLCPRNCFETFYYYDIETRNGDLFRLEHNYFTINIDHNRFPDQVIEHKPIMDWITLVSNLGGLLGMWLGLSILFICNKFINKLFDKVFTE